MLDFCSQKRMSAFEEAAFLANRLPCPDLLAYKAIHSSGHELG
jgi:hypothetical protein